MFDLKQEGNKHFMLNNIYLYSLCDFFFYQTQLLATWPTITRPPLKVCDLARFLLYRYFTNQSQDL